MERKETKFLLENVENSIIKMDRVFESMIKQFREGKKPGSKTFIRDIDNIQISGQNGSFKTKAYSLRRGEFNIWTGYNNEGKALDINTPIPTPNGFKNMGDLMVGDTVFDENGRQCKVTQATDVMNNHECFKVTFSDGSEIIADKDHRWIVDEDQVRASKARQARRSNERKLRGSDQRSKCLQSEVLTTGELFDSMSNGKRYGIELCKPVEYSEKVLKIHPYYLGCWLGDGSSQEPSITSADKELVEYISDICYTVTKRKSKYGYGVLGQKDIFRSYNLLNNKHIPFEYLFSNIEQRKELLRGLMDTDGFTDDFGRCEFTTIKERLFNDVYTLICSLGIKCYKTMDKAQLNGKYICPRYRLRFKATFPVFRLKRKAERQDLTIKSNYRIIKSITKVDSVPVKCISVDSPNNLYLCSESYIVTHNTQFLIFLSILQAIHEGKKTAFFSPENFPPDDFFDDIVHTITGKTTDRKSKDFCLTEDEYVHAIERVKDYFFFVYPMDGNKPDFRIDKIEQSLSYLAHEHDIFMAVIDPYIKIRHEMLPGEPEHLYASRFMMDRINFTRSENISYHMVMHQTTPRREKKEQNYPKPNLYNIKGGGTFADSADNVLTVWRPYRGEDPLSTQVSFISEKIKKQKLVGIPYEVEMDFDRKTNRYKGLDGTDYFDGTVPPPKTMIPENNNVFKNVDNGFENEVAPF